MLLQLLALLNTCLLKTTWLNGYLPNAGLENGETENQRGMSLKWYPALLLEDIIIKKKKKAKI